MRTPLIARSEYLWLALGDLGLGLIYLLLPDGRHGYFTGVAYRGPRGMMPLWAWGLLFVALAVGLLVLVGFARAAWAGLIGVGAHVVFAGAFLWAFIDGVAHPSHRSGGLAFALLLLFWAARHFRTARTSVRRDETG